MTLPKPPPLRRFHGLTPARSAVTAPTRERLRGMVREHEEKEKPFDPERRGSWRGGSRELVVNPSDFERDLKELIAAARLEDPDAAFEKATELLESNEEPDDVLRELDDLLEMHGVEAYPPQAIDPRYLYLNSGDTYNATLIYDTDENKYFVSTFGEIVEAEEPELLDEAWGEWIRGEVERAVRRDIEHDLDRTEAEKEALLERFDDFDDDALKRIFRETVSDVKGAEISTESDGSVYVHRIKEVCSEASDRVITKLQEQNPNARRKQPRTIEEDTPLIPSIVADNVIAELARFFPSEDFSGHAEGLAKKADRIYQNNEDFRKKMRARGDKGRDALYAFMRHWVAHELYWQRPDLYRKLPQNYSLGVEPVDYEFGVQKYAPRPTEETVLAAINAAGRDEGGYLRADLADVREKLSGSRVEQDELLKKLQQERKLVLYKNDNPMDVTARDEEAALYIAGQPRHLVILQRTRNSRRGR